MYTIEDLLIESGSDPAMTGKASDALRRKLEREWQARTAETLLTLPVERITGWQPWPDCGQLRSDNNGRVVVTLPDDFLRLLSMRLNCWEQPVTEILAPGHWLRRLQDNRHKGLGGTARHPRAFFTSDNKGRRSLELYGAPPDTIVEIAEAWYLPVPCLNHNA